MKVMFAVLAFNVPPLKLKVLVPIPFTTLLVVIVPPGSRFTMPTLAALPFANCNPLPPLPTVPLER